MNKKNLGLLFASVFLALAIFPFPAYASTTVTVVSPNGGETVSGTFPVTWTASDSEDAQNIDFNLYYSISAGVKGYKIADTDLSSCDLTESTFWVDADTNYFYGLEEPIIDEYTTGIAAYLFDGKQYLSVAGYTTLDGEGDANIDLFKTFYWDSDINSWINDSANFVLDDDMLCTTNSTACSFTIYEDAGNYYMTSTYNFGDNEDDFKMQGWKLTGGLWQLYSAAGPSGTLSDGSPGNIGNNPIRAFRLSNSLFLLSLASGGTPIARARGWHWNGTNWSLYSPIDTFYSTQGFCLEDECIVDYIAFDYVVGDDRNYLVVSGENEDAEQRTQMYYFSDGERWLRDADENYGLTINDDYLLLASLNYIDGKPIIYAKERAPVEQGLTFVGSKIKTIADLTSKTFSCSYNWDTSSALNGTWYLDIAGKGSSTVTDSSSSNFLLSNYLSSNLFITPIKNVSSVSYDAYGASLQAGGSPDEMIWSSKNNVIGTIMPRYVLEGTFNSNKAAFVYTSTDGENWTFSDTLTFGSTMYNPVQKIWDLDSYDFSFSDTLLISETTFYKIKFDDPALAWETIGGSTDWINVNPPTPKMDVGGEHYWDVFQNSELTKIYSYTIGEFPDLTSIDLDEGFYIQFTGYASEDIDLNIGYRDGGVLTGTEISLTTSPTRISVLVDPSGNDAQLAFNTISETPATVYLTDYAVIPIAYFYGTLGVSQFDGSLLKWVLRDGVPKAYVSEGIPFSFETKIYDRDLDLNELIIEARLNGILAKTYIFNIDSLNLGKKFVFNEVIDGVIDYNGAASYLGSLLPLSEFELKAVLVNSNDENVSEQKSNFYFLQYPYFPADLDFSIAPLSHKVGSFPSFSFVINQKRTDPFLGIVVSIYDVNHSRQNPNFGTIIYASELGCDTLISCEKQITLDNWLYPPGQFSLSVGALLTTEDQNFTNFLTLRDVGVLTSYVDFDTARVLQVFERSDNDPTNQYTNTEQIPLVFQVRADTLENMQGNFAVYLTFDIYDGVAQDTQTTAFFPERFIYDDLTGYNYWFWNDLLYTDEGELLPDGNTIGFRAHILPLGETAEISLPYGLTNKCDSYPSDFFYGTFLMNWIGFVGDALYGCVDPADQVISYLSGSTIDINSNYTPRALQNHSVLCLKTDDQSEFDAQLGDEFICALLYLKSEEQIDKFSVKLANDHSDFGLVGNEKQYIEFEVDQESAMFNDVLMLRSALATEFDTGEDIYTLGQLISAGFDKLLPYGQGVVDYTQWLAGEGFITNAGADINLEHQLDPNVVSGMFFFKVDGMSVINQYNYIEQYPELETLNPKYFRRFANNEGIDLPIKQALVRVYDRGFSVFKSFKVDSPLVIYSKPSEAQRAIDDNTSEIKVIPTVLKFNFIVDMFSANETKGVRAFVPIVFSYFVPAVPISLAGILAGLADVIEDPWGWAMRNWFLILMGVILSIIVCLNYARLKSGGTSINVFNRTGPGG